MLPSTERKEVDDVKIEIDFCSDESVYPFGVDIMRVSQDCCLAFGRCSTDKNDASTELRLKIELPIRGKRFSVRCFADSSGATLLQSGDV